MRSVTLVVTGVVVAILGIVFALQGIGLLKGSSMSDTTTWSIAGPLIALVGAAIAWSGSRPPR